MVSEVICLAYGGGGHDEQGRRLASVLEKDYKIMQIGDVNTLRYPGITIGELRDKETGKLNNLNLIIRKFLLIWNFLKTENIQRVISLGTGHCVLVALVCKLQRIKFAHIESWSRFESLSLTSKVILLLGFEVWVQNCDLYNIVKKNKIKLIGRL